MQTKSQLFFSMHSADICISESLSNGSLDSDHIPEWFAALAAPVCFLMNKYVFLLAIGVCIAASLLILSNLFLGGHRGDSLCLRRLKSDLARFELNRH